MTIPSRTDAARPFLPTKDFETSRAFYEVLGFSKLLDGDVAIFGIGPSTFILQRYYQKDWADNFMMQLMVEDLDGWWEHIQALDLPGRFGVKSPKAPVLQSWGLLRGVSLRSVRRALACCTTQRECSSRLGTRMMGGGRASNAVRL